MVTLPSKTCVNFNQTYNYADLSAGGNCFAYAILFLTYIIAHRALYSNLSIDYSGLKKILREFPSKTELQGLQNHYFTREYSKCEHQILLTQNLKSVLDHEIALLNKNTKFESTQNLEEICQIFCKDIHSFVQPTFYLLRICDTQTILGHELSHIVALYLASPKELHFFDANSGLHIINIASNVNEESLQKTLLELIFKKNFIMKWFDTKSNTIEYDLTSSRGADKLNVYQQHIKLAIRDHLINHTDHEDFLVECDELNDREKNFIERLAYFIDIIRNVHFNNKTNPYKTFSYCHQEHPQCEIELKPLKSNANR